MKRWSCCKAEVESTVGCSLTFHKQSKRMNNILDSFNTLVGNGQQQQQPIGDSAITNSSSGNNLGKQEMSREEQNKRKTTKKDEFEQDAFDHVFGSNNNNNNNNNGTSNKVSSTSSKSNNSMENLVIEGDYIIHTVSPGDTLERIAVRYDRNVSLFLKFF